MVLEGGDLEDEATRPVRLNLAPMLAAWALHRGFDDAVILGAVRIGDDNQPIAVMLDGIVMLRFAPADDPWNGRRILGIDQAYLGGLVVVHTEQQEAAALGEAET